MNKEIQMFEIAEHNDVVGTQIFDPNLPSNIDFDHQEENAAEHSFINPEKISHIGKVIIIGDELKSYRVKGKCLK